MKADHSDTAVIRSFKPEEEVKAVEYLGRGPANFIQHSGVLIVDLPKGKATDMPGALKIMLKDRL